MAFRKSAGVEIVSDEDFGMSGKLGENRVESLSIPLRAGIGRWESEGFAEETEALARPRDRVGIVFVMNGTKREDQPIEPSRLNDMAVDVASKILLV